MLRQTASEAYWRLHRVIPLVPTGKLQNGPDVPENIIVICPNFDSYWKTEIQLKP